MAQADTNVLASATTSASYNMVLQLFFRLLTFGLNAFTLRYISKDMLGVVNVRLTLLYSTILFVAREAFRRACTSHSKDQSWQQVVNLLWCTVPIGMVAALLFGLIWSLILEQPDPQTIPLYGLGVVSFALSAVVELLAEPLWIVAQLLLFVRLKVLVYGFSLAVRAVLTVAFIQLFPEWGLITFSLVQVVFTLLYTCMFYAYFAYYLHSSKAEKDFPFHGVRDFFPKSLPGKPWISRELASLTWSFVKQSFLKQILTEGERYVMTVFNLLSFGDQGVYDVINNLGSLAARFLFLPIEDSAYLLFSQTLHRGSDASKQDKDALSLGTRVLESLLKVVTLIALTILVFGYAYSFLLLDLYGGQILSSGSGPSLLRWYCMYVLLLAINGVTEGFVFATMSKSQVDRYNHKMLVFSIVFLVSSWFLTKQLGSIGFILANCCNMAARIAHSYITSYFKSEGTNPLLGILPSISSCAAYFGAFLITVLSERALCCHWGVLWRLVHIAIGGLSLLVVLVIIFFSERKLFIFIQEQYRKHKAGKLKSQ